MSERADTRRVDRQKGGMWLWLLQRVTAVILLFGLLTHLAATHIFSMGELSYGNIGDRLQSIFFICLDVLLLGSAVFHGLVGVRMVLLDYTFKEKARRRVLDVCLLVMGLAAFAFGVWALWPWIST